MFVEREIVKTRNILLAIFSVQFRVINMAILLYLYNTYKHRGEGKQGIDIGVNLLLYGGSVTMCYVMCDIVS